MIIDQVWCPEALNLGKEADIQHKVHTPKHSKMSNSGASLPAGDSSLASTPLANPDSASPPPVTSPAFTSSNGPGRADQSMDRKSESVTSSDQPNGSLPTAPTPVPVPASSPGRDPAPTLATPIA